MNTEDIKKSRGKKGYENKSLNLAKIGEKSSIYKIQLGVYIPTMKI